MPKMKKKTQIAKKYKHSTDLIDPNLVEDVIADIASNSQDSRMDRFILFWLFGLSPNKAGLKAGYSPSYSASGLLKKLKYSKTVRERIEKFAAQAPLRYRQVCQMRLATIANIEGKGLKLMEDDPKLAIEKPQFLKQLKQSAGVLADDSRPGTTLVSIGTLNLLQERQRRQLLGIEDDTDVVDGEVEDGETA